MLQASPEEFCASYWRAGWITGCKCWSGIKPSLAAWLLELSQREIINSWALIVVSGPASAGKLRNLPLPWQVNAWHMVAVFQSRWLLWCFPFLVLFKGPFCILEVLYGEAAKLGSRRGLSNFQRSTVLLSMSKYHLLIIVSSLLCLAFIDPAYL